MNQYLAKTVIVPWDFSDRSVEALKSTLDMVDDHDKIRVVHVTPYPHAADPAGIWDAVSEETMVESLRKAFDKACEDKELPSDLKLTIMFGDPGARITELASESDAGLVVISSHGRTGLSRLFLGSVAERVVRLSPCPVLVLRQSPEA